MNTQDFLTVLDYMEKEKGISRKVMTSVIENALVTAAHKTYPLETEIRVTLDAKTGKIQMFAKLKATDRAKPNPEEISIIKARAVNPFRPGPIQHQPGVNPTASHQTNPPFVQ